LTRTRLLLEAVTFSLWFAQHPERRIRHFTMWLPRRQYQFIGTTTIAVKSNVELRKLIPETAWAEARDDSAGVVPRRA